MDSAWHANILVSNWFICPPPPPCTLSLFLSLSLSPSPPLSLSLSLSLPPPPPSLSLSLPTIEEDPNMMVTWTKFTRVRLTNCIYFVTSINTNLKVHVYKLQSILAAGAVWLSAVAGREPKLDLNKKSEKNRTCLEMESKLEKRTTETPGQLLKWILFVQDLRNAGPFPRQI